MSKANVGCRISTKFERPSKELVELFLKHASSNIADCMNRTAAVCSAIRPINKTKLLGPAFTVKVAQGDNLMFHKAMDLAQPGDVIVIDAGGMSDRAIFGEIMATYCRKRGIAGIIVDGDIRDCAELAEMDIAIYARGANPNGPYKNGPGEIGTVISFGGQVVHPGDIIVGDADGIVVIRPADAKALAAKVDAVLKKEQETMQIIDRNGTFDRPWMDAKLAEIGCEYLD